jgi:hypothetical protein
LTCRQLNWESTAAVVLVSGLEFRSMRMQLYRNQYRSSAKENAAMMMLTIIQNPKLVDVMRVLGHP